MSKWITFREEEPSPKTKRWTIIANGNKSTLGWIEWYNPWRKYCFTTTTIRCIFEQDCLRDIANFIETETTKHKIAIRKAKEAI